MPHILFLMSDTGGGHRAAARSIEAALQERYPGQFTCELVDVWKNYTGFPFNTMPDTYSRWVNTYAASYSAQFWLMEHVLFRQKWFNRLYNNYAYERSLQMYTEHPADIIVCVHSAFVRGAVNALRRAKLPMPFITVISDYALPPIMWYDAQVDRCLAPTQPAYDRGLWLGLKPGQLVLTGAPVHPKFTRINLTKQQAREQLGWSPDARIVLMVGGGDGMGPLVATARAIDERRLNCQLMIVAGRNQAMKQTLDSIAWNRPTCVYGFVDNMQVLMTAADVLITKAGPATITEAALVGLPLVLSGAIKYQESPNVDYVLAHNAGVYAPGPKRVAQAIQELLSDDGTRLCTLEAGIKTLAQPDAIWNIADQIHAFA